MLPEPIGVETIDPNIIAVTSPFLPAFPAAAHALGGRFFRAAGHWKFDARDEDRVRALLREMYGTDGTHTEEVDVRVTLPDRGLFNEELHLFGRRLARRPARDARVQLGAQVVVIEGGFPDWGGSVKYPALQYELGTVLEVRDLPAGAPGLDDEGVQIIGRRRLPAAPAAPGDGALQRGWWTLSFTGVPELTDGDREHIAEAITRGMTEGEIVHTADDTADDTA